MIEDSFYIEYIDRNDFCHLKADWCRLEKGNEMTVFQSYNWYKMIVDNSIPIDTSYFESIFVVVRSKSDNTAVLIAPLWIVKHKFNIVNNKCIYFIDREGWSDYLNIIYDVFNPKAFDFLLKSLHNKYHVKSIMFEMLKESTRIYEYICQKLIVVYDEPKPYVVLDVPNSSDSYYESLSKNTRQNIRTANNRLEKEGLCISYNFVDESTSRDKCVQIRQEMFLKKYEKVPLLRKIKYRLVNKFKYHYPKCNPIYDYADSKIMTAYVGDNLASFFCYLLDESKRSVVVISAGTNPNFAWFSPGILLMYNFVNHIIFEKKYGIIDFTRGDEKYKFSLGGASYNYHTVFIHF